MSHPVIIDDDDVEVPLAPEGWSVNSEDRAAWAVDRLLQLEEHVDRLERQYERNKKRAQKELDRARAFFEPQLQLYWYQHQPQRGKTLHLATGDLSYRTVPGGVRIEVEADALEWAEAHAPETIRREIVRKLDFAAAKRVGERIFNEHLILFGSSLRPPTTQAEAFERAQLLLMEGAKALPPGMVLRQDEQIFEVKAPRTKGAK